MSVERADADHLLKGEALVVDSSDLRPRDLWMILFEWAERVHVERLTAALVITHEDEDRADSFVISGRVEERQGRYRSGQEWTRCEALVPGLGRMRLCQYRVVKGRYEDDRCRTHTNDPRRVQEKAERDARRKSKRLAKHYGPNSSPLVGGYGRLRTLSSPDRRMLAEVCEAILDDLKVPKAGPL